ncbi:hypothetical protein [Saccharopolyspora spinosa]|uniref:Uncharacterized protein n=1 Tax=Saccharopolyspora spinosa TaxID=60894 RepID=A0A2N3Y6K0_SACSN|nr:hypothetical protein [Saccharopolyspora spinosa]PKW18495.1 hypothetical protein A8926_6586 [Saccharopolyspora spinosa]
MTEWFELHVARPEIVPLSADQEKRLRDLVDVMIPANGSFPSGSSVVLDDERLAQALAYRPDLAEPLCRILDRVDDELLGSNPEQALADLARDSAPDFDSFGKLVAGAYLMSPVVKKTIGYPGQEAQTLADDTGQYLDMLMRVAERGPRFRPTSTG